MTEHMTEHAHTELVHGCFPCALNADEELNGILDAVWDERRNLGLAYDHDEVRIAYGMLEAWFARYGELAVWEHVEQQRAADSDSMLEASVQCPSCGASVRAHVAGPGERDEIARLQSALAQAEARITQCRAKLEDLARGVYASTGRDFGRGVALAVGLLLPPLTDGEVASPRPL